MVEPGQLCVLIFVDSCVLNIWQGSLIRKENDERKSSKRMRGVKTQDKYTATNSANKPTMEKWRFLYFHIASILPKGNGLESLYL